MTSPEHHDPEIRRIKLAVQQDIQEHWANFPKPPVVEVVEVGNEAE